MLTILKKIYKRLFEKIYYSRNIKYLGLSYDEYHTFVNSLDDCLNEEKESILLNKKIYRTNKFWFAQCVIELFIDKVYWFDTNKKTPFIIDCGSNIGLSIIFFKQLYPDAKILAFEADNNICDISKKNIAIFDFSNVDIINAAVWIDDGEMSFLPDNSLGGRLDTESQNNESNIKIKTIRLKSYLDKFAEIDFLKMDIEGAEYEVLKDCSNCLNKVSNIFIEYHSNANNKQNLNEILNVLTDAGFRYYIKEASNIMTHPFIDNKNISFRVFDMQLNIFGYKKDVKEN